MLPNSWCLSELPEVKLLFQSTKMPLKTGPVSIPGRRIVREAFEGLQQTVSPLEAKDFQNTTLEDVQKAALAIENQLAARKTLRNMRRLMP